MDNFFHKKDKYLFKKQINCQFLSNLFGKNIYSGYNNIDYSKLNDFFIGVRLIVEGKIENFNKV